MICAGLGLSISIFIFLLFKKFVWLISNLILGCNSLIWAAKSRAFSDRSAIDFIAKFVRSDCLNPAHLDRINAVIFTLTGSVSASSASHLGYQFWLNFSFVVARLDTIIFDHAILDAVQIGCHFFVCQIKIKILPSNLHLVIFDSMTLVREVPSIVDCRDHLDRRSLTMGNRQRWLDLRTL